MSPRGEPDLPPGAQQPQADEVEADQPGDAWLSGFALDAKNPNGFTFLDHWHGHRWSRVPVPRLGKYSYVEAIAARGPADLWAVGVDAAGSVSRPSRPWLVFALHWNGHRWTRTASLNTGLRTVILGGAQAMSGGSVRATGFGKVWPGGSATRLPLALRWTGRSWDDTPMPAGRGELYQLARADRELWAVGDTFSPGAPSYTMDFLHWTGTRWVHAPVPLPGAGSLYGAASDPGGGMWAVGAVGGGSCQPKCRPVIERWS